MRNYFLQKEVHELIQDHVTDTAVLPTVQIDIVPSDLPYFMLRYDRLPDQTVKELEATEPIKEPMLKVVDMEDYTGDAKSILDELHTMYIMGLVVLRGSVYYMLPKAIELFYKPGEGFFDKMDSSDDDDRDMAVQSVIEHMTEYVLPGRWWRAYYAKKGLAPAVQPVVALQKEMEEIEAVLGLPMHV